ncbi:MAG: hypothetical protein LBK50_00125 [Candidatus Nomurabacteria bacterium]|jgi:hypothetical protein|nr:hypothetical protein [Candidatus Nomurabacteria bacterium]
MKKKTLKEIVIIAFGLVILLGGVWVSNNLQLLVDEFVIWQNPPSADAIDIAARTDMSELGQRIFYAARPQFDEAGAFNEHCSGFETTMIILGCYDGDKIYVFNVSDSRIADAKYVTAAHEMLHAAYERLDESERERVDGMLDQEYSRLDDPSLVETMAGYAQMEPGQRSNELHSIIGTEYVDLSPELEEYYGRYFTNQDVVALLAGSYKKVFTDLENEQTGLKSQMDALDGKIAADSSNYDATLTRLNADIAVFNGRTFSSEYEYNSARQALQARIDALDGLAAQIHSDIAQYNVWVEEYNELGGRMQQLSDRLDSRTQL